MRAQPIPSPTRGGLGWGDFTRTRWRYLLCLFSLLAGLIPGLAAPVAAAPLRQATPDDALADLAHCDELEPEALRDELNRISQGIFAEGEAGLDLTAIVEREWTARHVDAAVDRAVADAVNQARARTDWLERFLSGWSPSQAEALTSEVAALAFASEPFQQAIDDLAEAVAQAVAVEFAALSAESAAQTTLCLQAYIGGNYSQAFVAAFTDEIRTSAAQADLSVDDQLDSGLMTVLGQHRAALGGVGVIIAGQIAGRIVQRIGQDLARRVAGRIAGRVLGRVGAAAIPALGWIVGIGLIVYDLAEGRDGALPQIQAGLQSAEVKAAIRAEIIDAVEPELRQAAPQVAREISNELYAEWVDFQRKYQQVLALAGEHAQFRALLSDVTDLGHLASLVDVTLTAVGRSGFEEAFTSGDFQRMLALPPAAVEILRVARDFDAPLAWANLAGGQLQQVVALEIYKHKVPVELNRDTLAALIALNDRTAVARLILLEPDAMAALLRLSHTTLGELTARLSAAELAWMARYVDEMSATQANTLVAQVLQRPELMHRLQDERVASTLARSDNLNAALAFLARPAEPSNFPGDAWETLAGQVAPRLFVHKYGWPVTLGVTLGALLVVLAVSYSFVMWLFAPVRAFVRLLRAPFRRRSRETG